MAIQCITLQTRHHAILYLVLLVQMEKIFVFFIAFIFLDIEKQVLSGPSNQLYLYMQQEGIKLILNIKKYF